ncbi:MULTISPECIES: hypothetical protein [Bacillus]|uniref:hypothetical protein n=1 Tax=Bacillus TaxID=1386 RepID=UPI001CDB92BF|nr:MULTISPECIES: hypothetical protein [Bacillus]MCY7764955.1 hypothetical protein [Bacillus inaquosorum]MCY7950351.1 hypothetical protein [Bacillus inaquosorum]MCY9101372.1 hypothetical protein [Bacillus inaquosorum]MCY9176036.1 hypothetical protein [Bacillus inaquosorum]MCY9309068.1 hypothetical protein [Bacillus inaquosorum]
MSLFLYSIPLLVLVIGVIVTTKKILHTKWILSHLVTDTKKLDILLKNERHMFILFFDEMTCRNVIRNMNMLHSALKDTKVPFAIINTLEDYDYETESSPVFPYVDHFEIQYTPTLIFVKNGTKQSVHCQGPDQLQLGKVNKFLSETISKMNSHAV